MASRCGLTAAAHELDLLLSPDEAGQAAIASGQLFIGLHRVKRTRWTPWLYREGGGMRKRKPGAIARESGGHQANNRNDARVPVLERVL